MKKNKTTIGIVGTGRMGSVLQALFIRQNCFKVKQSSTSKKIDNRTIFSLMDVLSCDIVFLAIPMTNIPAFLSSIRSELFRRSPLIVDICSVKTEPAHWLKTFLPPHIDCVASHPLFGPFSTKNGTQFKNLPWFFSPVRVRDTQRFENLLSFLTRQKIATHTITPEDHDKIMSKTQAISFLFGLIGQRMHLDGGPFDTTGFSHILENQRIVSGDSQQLALDILRFNPFAMQMVKQVESEVKRITNELEIQNKNMVS